MMQSIQQFILICNSNNLSNNIHDGQSARGPVLPLCSLALPSHFLVLPSHTLHIPSRSPCIPLRSPCTLALPRTPSHSLARSLALPLTLPPHSLALLLCSLALSPHSSHALILCPNCTLSPCTFVSMSQMHADVSG